MTEASQGPNSMTDETNPPMVEKLARAMWKQERATKQHDEPFRLSWYEDVARAALTAIRDPDKGMVEAGHRYYSASPIPPQITRTLFTAMIDQALTGGR